MYNDQRFVLPRLFLIGGYNKLSMKLSSFFNGNKVIHAQGQGTQFSESWLFDLDDSPILPTESIFYYVEVDGENKYFVWNGIEYCEPTFYFSMQAYSNQYQDPIIHHECFVSDGEIDFGLDVESTINLYGKFIYQITLFAEGESASVLEAKQGLMVIGRNIDLENTLSMVHGTYGEGSDDEPAEIVYEEKIMYIVGSTPYEIDWLSDSAGGSPITPEMYVVYIIEDGDYAGRYMWQDDQYIKYENE